MTENQRMRMTHGVGFAWDGGMYIDVTVAGKPVEVINVGKPTEAGTEITISTREEFLAECDAWLGAQTAEQMRNWRHQALGYPRE